MNFAAHPPIDDPLIRCLICADAPEQIPADMQMFPATMLSAHVAQHINYRPHKCAKCDFQCNEATEVSRHADRHPGHRIIFQARKNGFLEDVCVMIVEECKRRNTSSPSYPMAETAAESTRQPKQENFVSAPSEASEATPSPPPMVQVQQQMEQGHALSGGAEYEQPLLLNPNPGTSMEATNGDQMGTEGLAPDLLKTLQDDSLTALSEMLAHQDNEQQLMDTTIAPTVCATAHMLGAHLVQFRQTPEQQSLNNSGGALLRKRPSNLQYRCVSCNHLCSREAREYHYTIAHSEMVLLRCVFCRKELTCQHAAHWQRHLRQHHGLTSFHSGMMERMEENIVQMKIRCQKAFVPLSSAQEVAANPPTVQQPPMELHPMQPRNAIPPPNRAPTSSGSSAAVQPESPIRRTVKQELLVPFEKKLRKDGRAKVQCAKCDEIIPDTEISKLNHANTRHFKRCLHRCILCGHEFYAVIGGGMLSNHMRFAHPRMPIDSIAKVQNYDYQLAQIQTMMAAELFYD